MPVITIRGQLGSEAPRIGKACAEALNIDYVDREIINKIADRLQRSREEILAKEILPTTLAGRITKALEDDFAGVGYSGRTVPDRDMSSLDNAHYMKGLKSVIRELAMSEAIVINGRGSQLFLKDYPGALHVSIIAPLETRVKRVMEDFGLNEEAARKRIARYDKSRREFIKKYFKADIQDPMHYDLVINTEHVSFDSAVSMIVEAASVKSKGVRSI